MALNGSSYYGPPADETHKPRVRRDSGKFVFFLLILGVVLAVVLVPGVRGRFEQIFPAVAASPNIHSAVTVWANKDTGIYYCADTEEFGKRPGTFMKQGAALTAGYQPEFEQYCAAPQAKRDTKN
jgi:hypothetical protein